jgi:hypothetical protein
MPVWHPRLLTIDLTIDSTTMASPQAGREQVEFRPPGF